MARERILNQTNQGELFAEEAWRKTFQVIPKHFQEVLI
jgi:hypothetical protein